MSLRSQAAYEFRENLNADGDSVILFSSPDIKHGLSGKVVRTDVRIDPGTKETFHEPKTTITLSILDLPNDFEEGMEVQAKDVTGEVVSGVVMSPDYDKTIGFVVFTVEVAE